MFEIPEDRLPEGFVDTVIDPPAHPAAPRAAATIVLMRDGDEGPETLLMRRQRSSGFVPGAWVFPGGRVDSADSGPALHERITGLPRDPVPDSSFWSAAVREAFEEAGVLLARHTGGDWVPDAAADGGVDRARRGLMEETTTIADVLEDLDAALDVREMVHIAHWVTPVVEPRRYDTHFFAAPLPPGRSVQVDPREMTEAAWLAPRPALARFERGELPMVFPTVKTLESLATYESVEHALASLRDRAVPRTLPRLVRTERGVAIVID